MRTAKLSYALALPSHRRGFFDAAHLLCRTPKPSQNSETLSEQQLATFQLRSWVSNRENCTRNSVVRIVLSFPKLRDLFRRNIRRSGVGGQGPGLQSTLRADIVPVLAKSSGFDWLHLHLRHHRGNVALDSALKWSQSRISTHWKVF